MSTNNEKAKADFMEACMKDHDQAICERMWNDSKAGTKDEINKRSQDYATLARAYEDLKIDNTRTKEHLKQALNMLSNNNARIKAEKDAERFKLIEDIFFDCRGMYSKEQLNAMSDDELTGIRKGLDVAKKDDPYANVGASADTHSRRKPDLTAGEWDPETKTWRRGI